MRKEILNEINRMKEIMSSFDDFDLLTESPNLRVIANMGGRLAKNSLDDFVRQFGDEVGDLVRKMSKVPDGDTEGLFKLINDLDAIDDDAAKVFRADLRVILPSDVDEALTKLTTYLEDNINNFNDIDGTMKKYMDGAFPDSGDELKTSFIDMVKDESSVIKRKSQSQNIIRNQDLDELLRTLDSEGDRVEGAINQLDIPQNERNTLKRFWSSFWVKKETLYDHLRRVSKVSGEEAAQLAAMTDAEIDKLIRTAADPTAAVTDKDALKALRLAMSQNMWRSLPGWVRKSIIFTILSGGFAISVVKFIANAGFGLMAIGEDKLDEYKDKINVSVGGGINKLKPENEDKTLPVIQQLQPDLFDNTGGLKSEYSLSYPTDGSNVDVIDNNTFNVVHTFTLDQINSKL